MRENEESIKHLHQLLQITCQERDEAKAQLQRLLNTCSLLTDHGICCWDSGNLGLVGQKRPLVQEFNGSTSGDVVDVLVKGRSLPRKGRLLKAVIEAGPLLRTLMVLGHVPRWRNPPSLPSHQCSVNSVQAKKLVMGATLGDLTIRYDSNGTISTLPFTESRLPFCANIHVDEDGDIQMARAVAFEKAFPSRTVER
ncbi:hypothetical protein RJ640_024192 [Escallonia rubra]|uniref:Uncharacterized protein n=1 Tax=Escallonia rubra TaxID=112253 RepID=A0AA88RD74_9ASTE|nr:hypothetical protein RJ640_024192 [Escallonia rubra]